MFIKKKALLWVINLLRRIDVGGGKIIIVIWSRAFTIVPTMIGHIIAIHN
jgi:ribosomal protein S19